MEPFKINDVVTPRTPLIRKSHGKGIVIESKHLDGPKLTVLFPVGARFITRRFAPYDLQSAEVRPRQLNMMMTHVNLFRAISSEQFSL